MDLIKWISRRRGYTMTNPIVTEPVNQRATKHAIIVSSDGHAMPRMADYREYLPADFRRDFDDFLSAHAENLSDLGIGDPRYLASRLDPEVLEDWVREVVEPGRLDGLWDPNRRLEFLNSEGIAAEVLFPDFGTAFELSPRVERALGYSRTPEQAVAAGKAHNRWLAEYCRCTPTRFAGLAIVSFDDVDAAVEEIHWAREAGLKGIVLPTFDEAAPLYHPRNDPIWAALEDLELPANSHAVTSSTTRRQKGYGDAPHPACGQTMMSAELFFGTRQILAHLIWGGVLERHPRLKIVLTEQGSGWVPSTLAGMDYSYSGSYLQRSLREVIRIKPSEYFARQIYLGSSIFSREEIELRQDIGLDKMMLGMDYPHHEGTWAAGPGTLAYLRATLGSVGVPAGEAAQLLGETAIKVFGFDRRALDGLGREIGPDMAEVLRPPTEDLYPRGDVKKPIGVGFQ
jgi:predicted TIM-barrel fold metal-dependent hydrolase